MYNPHNNMGIIQTIRVKKLSQEISNLKTSKRLIPTNVKLKRMIVLHMWNRQMI